MQSFLSDSQRGYEGSPVCLHLSEQSCCCWKPSAICCGDRRKDWCLWLAKVSGWRAMEAPWDDISHVRLTVLLWYLLIKALVVNGMPAGTTLRRVLLCEAPVPLQHLDHCCWISKVSVWMFCFRHRAEKSHCHVVIQIALEGNAVFELFFITLLYFYLQNHFKLW